MGGVGTEGEKVNPILLQLIMLQCVILNMMIDMYGHVVAVTYAANVVGVPLLEQVY